MAAIEPGLRAAASAIARPRSRTSVIASSSVIASAAASAANSPTEWPITKSALMPRSCRAASIAREVATSAGCCTAVSTSSSASAWKQRRSRSRPVAALPRLKTSIAAGTASAKSRPMPASTDPWPGKQKAILFMPGMLPSSASARFPR